MSKAITLLINAGINGNNTRDLLRRLNQDVLQQKPELVIMLVGTNDMLSERSLLSLQEYEKNYVQLITGIKDKADLVLMTIPPVNAGYIVGRSPQLGQDTAAIQGRVDGANNIISTLAAAHACTLIDLYQIFMACGGSTVDKNCLFQNEANSGVDDGVHPRYEGYLVMAAAIYGTLKMQYSLARNIVCFGDSITYGYGMVGEGTVQGQSYPAILNRMLNPEIRKHDSDQTIIS